MIADDNSINPNMSTNEDKAMNCAETNTTTKVENYFACQV
jgi:hypothetical protein